MGRKAAEGGGAKSGLEAETCYCVPTYHICTRTTVSCSCTCHEHEFLLFLLLREYLLFFALEGSRRRLLPAKANYM